MTGVQTCALPIYSTDGIVRPNIHDYDYVFPLPNGFIQSNTGSQIPQNIGWDNGTYDNSK